MALMGVACQVRGAEASDHESHGTEFIVIVGADGTEARAISSEQVDLATTFLQERLSVIGAEFTIEPASGARLLIRVGEIGTDLLARVRVAVSRFGWIEFRLVHLERPGDDGEPAPDGYEEMTLEGGLHDEVWTERLWVKRMPEMAGDCIAKALVYADQFGSPQVELEMTRAGATRFGEITREMATVAARAGHRARLAIVIDGRIVAAPVVIEGITGGRANITGTFTEREAIELCNLLNNPLDVPIRLVEERKF